MRDDDGFEIDRAFDLLPHVVGASWATIWFRMNKIKEPTQEEFRNKVVEYIKKQMILCAKNGVNKCIINIKTPSEIFLSAENSKFKYLVNGYIDKEIFPK